MKECPLCQGQLIVTRARGDFAIAERCRCQMPCPQCDGSGFFFELNESGYEVTKPCRCRRLDQSARSYVQAKLPARYANAHFGRIEVSDQGSDIAAARRTAWRFSKEFESGVRGLLFHGPSGTGKTLIATCILRYLLLERGVRARFVEFMHLLADLRATFGDRGRAEQVMAPLVEIPVLVIDELGKGRGSEWELSVLDELISKRYNAQRTTVFTTNFSPDEPVADASQSGSMKEEKLVDRVGARIYSRLMEMCEPVRLHGPDYRRKLATDRR